MADAPLFGVSGLTVEFTRGRSLRGRVAGRTPETVRAVDGVSFTVAAGEMVALVGESGSGKSTTALASLRLLEPQAGSVNLNGHDLNQASPRELRALRRRMQLIYQDPYASLDPRFRVGATVTEPLAIHGLGSRSERRARVTEALERVELSPAEAYVDRFPHELSGGQRQRVAIAASLVLQPEFLVADEPVSMLDVSVRAGVLSLLTKLRMDGLGILMITHDLSTAAHYADRILVMYLGRIVEEGPARDVIHAPQHPYTCALLSVVPRADPSEPRSRQLLTGEIPNAADIPPGCRFHPRCPIAESRCRTVDPELEHALRASTAEHRAACHVTAPAARAQADSAHAAALR